MIEPTEIGTIVRDKNGQLWSCVDPKTHAPWFGAKSIGYSWRSWSELDKPVLVHEGYSEPTPEPQGRFAVVLDADGHPWWKPYEYWERSGTCCPWNMIKQPVTIVFEGVDDSL